MGYDVSCEGMEEEECYSNDGFEAKSPSAIDFFDINELCEDTEQDAPIEDKDDIDDISKSVLSQVISKVEHRALEDITINSDKPLAAVLPSKYLEVDVKALFPEFRHDQVLRFQRLFGIGKESNMPDIWRSVRKRRSEQNGLRTEKPPLECEVELDEEFKFLQHKEKVLKCSSESDSLDRQPLNNPWRFGAARLWYDVAEVPENAETFDYGFKLAEEDKEPEEVPHDIPDESFLMVSQCEWEDDVIWDGEEMKEQVMDKVYAPKIRAGWIPVSLDRTVASYWNHVNYVSSHSEVPKLYPSLMNRNQLHKIQKEEITRSLFPEENPKLLYDRWEDDVIWDSEAMPRINYPKPVEHDSDIILEIPDDKPPSPDTDLEPVKAGKDKKFLRTLPKKPDEDDAENEDSAPIKTDFYNISNDEYYNPKMTRENALKLNYGGSLLQHSIPALDLQAPYFQTNIGPMKIKRFHRPTLKKYSHGKLAEDGFHGVRSLTSRIRKKEAQRQRELKESGGGEMFFMRTPNDLSAKDGEVLLFEFSEEHPPLLNQIGMASRIRNYYRRKPGKDTTMPNYKYGELAYAHTSPFLGVLQPGQSVQAYENHLFRAPIYQHSVEGTDFLVIRTRNRLMIREVETIYTVGQELPLIDVPAPNSEKASSFLKDFLMVHIYKLFWKSTDRPRKVRMEDIKKAFPLIREFTIRKRLGTCAEFQRTGFDSKYWVLKSGFRLPSVDELRVMVSPEQCCAFNSMLAAENRLKEAGYGDKFLFTAEDESDVLQNKLDDEVKAAPWNTTQAFINAVSGKCLLELSGVGDPTGCGEGFSYVKAPNKPQWSKDDNNQHPSKRLVKGTDADLRRLSLPTAKKLLKSFNVSDKEIKNMTRWQVIDVVRTLSTEQAKLGEEGITKYARGNLHSQAEHTRRYKEECQRLFDLQNRILSSNEVLSTDEDSSSDEDSDLEELGKNLEDMLSNKKSMKELSHEHEEAERKELHKMMTSGEGSLSNKPADKAEPISYDGMSLKLYRTYANSDGTEFVRVETVRKPEVIQLYLKIRESKDREYIRNYSLDEQQKEEYRKEKRRIQDQLRRIKMKELKGSYKEPPRKKMKIEAAQMLKVKCGACGGSGHMRTNRACPLYQCSSPSLPPIQVAMTEEQEEAAEKAALEDQNLIKVDETKIIVSKKLINHADEIRRKSLVLKIPKDAVANANRKRNKYIDNDDAFSDYISTPKGIHRKRVDPVVSISVIFEKLISELKALPGTKAFWLPVSAKEAPNYFDIIKRPMDLLTMKDKSRQQKYKSREDFLNDLQQILDNSDLYNGTHSYLSITAHKMMEHCINKFSEEEEKLMELEKTINPLLDNAQVAFSFMLETLINEELKAVPESWPFHKPVDKRSAKGYYNMVKNPMDLDTLIKNCKSNKYTNRTSFLTDVELIYSNSVIFNGATSQFTKIARDIVNAARGSLELYGEQFGNLEEGIRELQAQNPNNNHCESPPRRLKLVVKPIVKHDPRPTNLNGSADSDMFVDVESVDTAKNSSVVDPMYYDQSYANSESFLRSENEESNPSFQFRDFSFDLGVPASPSVPTQQESLLHSNGVLHNPFEEDLQQGYSQPVCDTISEDLMLSESDSEEDMEEVGALHF